MSINYDDELWMKHALILATEAGNKGEIPVGAVLILNNNIIGEGCNCSINYKDPTAHAEIIALRQGSKKIGNYRLLNTTLYVTLEPCIMCIGAIIHARINRLVFGAKNKKNTLKKVSSEIYNTNINHKIIFNGGILANTCSNKLKKFFKHKRMQHKTNTKNKNTNQSIS